MPRYIFITGGVASSLGKGLATAALGALLQARGFRVRLRKLDPYLNVDPGTMSPYEHGEVFVTDDGAETDLDLGHYERFTGVPCTRTDNTTAGRIFHQILSNEREGIYLGQTVQIIPHVTDAIKAFITADSGDVDFVLIEIGGTVGDIEGLPFFEAIRQLRNELELFQAVNVHLTLLPFLEGAGEQKTKPTQHSVKELRSIGIQPDVLLVRCDRSISIESRKKIALFCNVRRDAVIPAQNVDSIYSVPGEYHEAGLDAEVLRALAFDPEKSPARLERWFDVVTRIRAPDGEVQIAVVGKYMGLPDAYKSLREALTHGGIANHVDVTVRWIDAVHFESGEADQLLEGIHGILVPGAFGKRGSEGKIAACQYSREKSIPFLGICFGMQMAVLDTARNLAGLNTASSSEFGSADEPLVGLLTEWSKGDTKEIRGHSDDLGGSMRLGVYQARVVRGSLLHGIYQQELISERHRHRYEVNIGYREQLEHAGLRISAVSPDGRLPEAIERMDHPWFVGVQFHPELKSQPLNPHPLFRAFIEAARTRSSLV